MASTNVQLTLTVQFSTPNSLLPRHQPQGHSYCSYQKLLGFFKNRSVANKASGGVATFDSNSLKSENITIISDLKVVATLVKFQKKLM